MLAPSSTLPADESPALGAKLRLALPDEKFRRVGQSAVAASLPEA